MQYATSLNDEVRAAFTERVLADLARLIADSLAARASVASPDRVERAASARLHRQAADHDRKARDHEERVALLRQLEHDGRLETTSTEER